MGHKNIGKAECGNAKPYPHLKHLPDLHQLKTGLILLRTHNYNSSECNLSVSPIGYLLCNKLRANDGSQHAEPRIGIDFFTSNQPGKWRQDPISCSPLALGQSRER